jgi:hypothetical protein
MSLEVPPELAEQARQGEVDQDLFVETIRTSLPYAWEMVEGLTRSLAEGGDELADNQVPPPDEAARGQLLRALASNSIRAALERHFGVRLAFQNCHRVAVFRRGSVDGTTYREFTSARAQVLNQSPDLRDC